ncbi:MAG: hemerythrin domain-containing protein [Bacteroidales bacterium]
MLMIEHRLIERMLIVIKDALTKIEFKHEIDPVFVDIAVDFIRVYADRTHHGKEEDILMRELKKKTLSPADQQVMNELIREHVLVRQTTALISSANDRYRNGDDIALIVIANNLKTLIEFFPKHIEKEDKKFYPASRTYFTDEEDEAMLAEFGELDRKMVYEKYKAVVEKLENQK